MLGEDSENPIKTQINKYIQLWQISKPLQKNL